MSGEMRIGNGYDVHRTASGRPLFLGGVCIPGGPGLDGHSDADVVLHALMDALLGATGQSDIGVLFPNTDDEYKGVASGQLVRVVMSRLDGWSVVNADVTLVSERPKVSPYRDEIRSSIAKLLEIDVSRVGFKATTREGLGAIGQGEGMEAYAVVLLKKL
jgi:2-C-methyl-D-erythritol 2,4-cyclodiphosphate synthase